MTLLYTDGVTETGNRQGEFLAVEGPVRFIAGRLGHPSQELCDSLVAALLDYQNPLDPGDDITLAAGRSLALI